MAPEELPISRHLTIVHKRQLAATFLRLTLTSVEPLAPFSPGYVYKLIVGPTQARSFTLRRVNPECAQVDIDFHLHGDTPAKIWLDSLNVGDTVRVLKERPESVPDLQSGKVLLHADETGFAAIAGLLEFWNNPEPPIVLLETIDPANAAYFDDCGAFPSGTHFELLHVDQLQHYGAALISWLNAHIFRPDKVMAACSGLAAGLLRAYCDQIWQLPEEARRLRAYWQLRPMVSNVQVLPDSVDSL